MVAIPNSSPSPVLQESLELSEAEIKKLIDRIRERVQAVDSAEAEQDYAYTTKRPDDMNEWWERKALLTRVHEESKSKGVKAPPIRLTTLNELAERFSDSGEEIHTRSVGKKAKEYYFKNELAGRIRKNLMDLISHPDPGKDLFPLNKTGLTGCVQKVLTEYLKEKGLGDFKEVLNAQGTLEQRCSEQTIKLLKHLHSSLTVPSGYSSLDLMVKRINRHLRRSDQIGVAEALDHLKSIEGWHENQLRWALPPNGNRPILCIPHQMALLLEGKMTGVELPPADWLTMREIRAQCGLKPTADYLRTLVVKMGARARPYYGHFRLRKKGGGLFYYSPDIIPILKEALESKKA
jgi:hypothetical protein